MSLFRDQYFIRFLTKFLLVFAVLYYGTIVMIGLATPGNYYVPFIDHYFAYYRWLKDSLLIASKFVLSIAGYTTEIIQPNFLKLSGGNFVIIAYDCLGYGVMSFWVAFVIANEGTWKLKLKWILTGCFFLWLINVIRISIFLIAYNKRYLKLLGWNHHTWFNIAAYGLIFFMIYLYDKKRKVFA